MNTGQKIALGIILLITAGIAGALIYWNTHKERIISQKLVKAIEGKSQGLYTVAYNDMDIKELSGFFSITDMSVGYDRHHYDSLAGIGKAPSSLWNISIPQLTLSGVKTPKALWGNEIVAQKLVIASPRIELIYTNAGKDADRNIPTRSMWRQMLGSLDRVKVDSLEIRNATIITKNIRDGKVIFTFHDVDVLLSDLNIDSTSASDPARILFAKTMDLHCGQIVWYRMNNLYRYSVSKLGFNSASRHLNIGNADIDPQLGEEAFVKSRRYQTDRLDIHFRDLHFINVDPQALMDEILVADRLNVGGVTLKAYRDLNIPRENRNRIGNYPHQEIMDLPVPFTIRKAVFDNAFIEYREKNDITHMVGDVKFHDGLIVATNLTNRPSVIARNNICHVEASASLLKLTPMKASMDLRLADKEGRFTIEGTVGGGDATKLNVLTVPMGLARIKRGNVKNLHFELEGSNTEAHGVVAVLYDSLKIDMLEMDESKGGIDKKDFTSFISHIVIKEENPKGNQEPRVIAVAHPRDVTRSLYNLVWKTIFEGVNKTIGNKKPMKRP